MRGKERHDKNRLLSQRKYLNWDYYIYDSKINVNLIITNRFFLQSVSSIFFFVVNVAFFAIARTAAGDRTSGGTMMTAVGKTRRRGRRAGGDTVAPSQGRLCRPAKRRQHEADRHNYWPSRGRCWCRNLVWLACLQARQTFQRLAFVPDCDNGFLHWCKTTATFCFSAG